MSNPRVSVVIPAYACAETISHVLDALFKQTVQPLQIIVVNDRSPDALDAAVAPYLDRIEYVKNERNLGLARTCNVGLRRTTAPFVMTLHSDCLLDPDYIERMLGHLDADPSIAVATGQYLFEDYNALGLSDRLFAALNMLPIETDRRNTEVYSLGFIEGKADLFRRDVVAAYDFFSENLSLTAEDQDLSAKIRRDGHRIVQDCRARFRVMFTGTSDSIRKVLRKQRTYGRGQAYVVIRYGLGIFADSTSNRKSRTRHRFGQLIFASLFLAAIGIACINPALYWIPLVWLFLRIIHYIILARRMSPQDTLIITVTGPVADVLYLFGMMEGAVKTILFGRA
ncbi:MAG: glycosyltransferase family 2 protein [Kiritimatiellae bacterium]|nr:glycosyltransferase family 2 protein [Kiritimatiellia bacterium]